MAENNEFVHLPLPLLYQGKPKLRGGGIQSARTKQNVANRIDHGNYMKRRSAELSLFWKDRRANRIENALPAIESGIPMSTFCEDWDSRLFVRLKMGLSL